MAEDSHLVGSDINQTGFQNFNNTTTDDILAIAYNNPGDMLAIASADHRLRVYAEIADRQWSLFDQWRGHDAEIIDASLSAAPHWRAFLAENVA